MLLNAGANPNIKDVNGQTALFYAFCDREITKALFKAGADQNIQDRWGYTAAMRFDERDDSDYDEPYDPDYKQFFMDLCKKSKIE